MRSTVGAGVRRGASVARAAVVPSPLSPPLPAHPPRPGPLSFWEVVPKLPDGVVDSIPPRIVGNCAVKVVILDTLRGDVCELFAL